MSIKFGKRKRLFTGRRRSPQQQPGQQGQGKPPQDGIPGMPAEFYEEEEGDRPPGHWVLIAIKFTLYVFAGVLLVLNIPPYIALIQKIAERVNADLVVSQANLIPVIGPAVASGFTVAGMFIYSLSGFALWFLFQTVELYPILSHLNIPFMRGLLRRLQRSPQIPVKPGDRPSVSKLKRRINRAVEDNHGLLLKVCWGFFGIDFMLMYWLYPPVNQTGEVDVTSWLVIFFGVFGVELIAGLLTLLNNVLDPSSAEFQTAKTREVKKYT